MRGSISWLCSQKSITQELATRLHCKICGLLKSLSVSQIFESLLFSNASFLILISFIFAEEIIKHSADLSDLTDEKKYEQALKEYCYYMQHTCDRVRSEKEKGAAKKRKAEATNEDDEVN